MSIAENYLVTGSMKGLGLALSQALIAQNLPVITHSRSKQNYSKINQVEHIYGDLSSERDVREIIQFFQTKKIKLKGIICNAGSGKSAAIGSEIKNDWKESFDKNFYSSVLLISGLMQAKLLKECRIIVIGSICASQYIPGAPATYSCAKAALKRFVQNYSTYLATEENCIINLELGNMIFEGSTWHEKLEKDPAQVEKTISNVPLKKLGSIEEIFGLIFWFLTSKSQFATGTSIRLDGGQVSS